MKNFKFTILGLMVFITWLAIITLPIFLFWNFVFGPILTLTYFKSFIFLLLILIFKWISIEKIMKSLNDYIKEANKNFNEILKPKYKA